MRLVLCPECKDLLRDGGFDIKLVSTTQSTERKKCSNCERPNYECKVYEVESSRKAHSD